MFIATRRPHLCDVCITSLVYRVYRLVLYTSRLSSYSLTAFGSVVLIQQLSRFPSSSLVLLGPGSSFFHSLLCLAGEIHSLIVKLSEIPTLGQALINNYSSTLLLYLRRASSRAQSQRGHCCGSLSHFRLCCGGNGLGYQ